jgi:hypothetical protein
MESYSTHFGTRDWQQKKYSEDLAAARAPGSKMVVIQADYQERVAEQFGLEWVSLGPAVPYT